jgi:hypothetical protein
MKSESGPIFAPGRLVPKLGKTILEFLRETNIPVSALPAGDFLQCAQNSPNLIQFN